MPSALAVDWEQIKLAAVAGVPFKDLAAQWGLLDEAGQPDTTAIRQRCWREKWPVPSAIVERAKKMIACNKPAITAVTDPAKEAISASLAQISERHPLKMALFLEKKLSQAVERDTLPEITSWKEANTADSMLRRAVGLDRATVAVQINNSWSTPGDGGWTDEVGTGSVVETEGDFVEE